MVEEEEDDENDVWMSDDGGDIIIVSREQEDLNEPMNMNTSTTAHDPHAGYNESLVSQTNNMPIEIARVHRDHSQQGYLDGIVRGKNEGLQTGFDTGYPWGAQIGLDRGKVLGVCQGLQALSSDQWFRLCQEAHCFLSSSTATIIEPKALLQLGPQGLLEKCKSLLSDEALFSKQFWTPVGTPRFEDQDHHPLISPWIVLIDSTLLPALRNVWRKENPATFNDLNE